MQIIDVQHEMVLAEIIMQRDAMIVTQHGEIRTLKEQTTALTAKVAELTAALEPLHRKEG